MEKLIRLHVAAIDDDFRVCRAEAGNSSLIADVSSATHAFAEAKGCRPCREDAASDDNRRWVEGPAATWRLVMPDVRQHGARRGLARREARHGAAHCPGARRLDDRVTPDAGQTRRGANCGTVRRYPEIDTLVKVPGTRVRPSPPAGGYLMMPFAVTA